MLVNLSGAPLILHSICIAVECYRLTILALLYHDINITTVTFVTVYVSKRFMAIKLLIGFTWFLQFCNMPNSANWTWNIRNNHAPPKTKNPALGKSPRAWHKMGHQSSVMEISLSHCWGYDNTKSCSCFSLMEMEEHQCWSEFMMKTSKRIIHIIQCHPVEKTQASVWSLRRLHYDGVGSAT